MLVEKTRPLLSFYLRIYLFSEGVGGWLKICPSLENIANLLAFVAVCDFDGG